MNPIEKEAHTRAIELSTNNQLDEAYKICDHWLCQNPNSTDWLLLMQYLMMQAGKKSIAYHLGKRLCGLAPKDPTMWMNFGMAASDVWMLQEAERAFDKGLKVAKKPETKAKLHTNWAATLIDNGLFSEAEPHCEAAIKANPDDPKGIANLGFCQLARRNWAEGWKNYRLCYGTEFRPMVRYGNEPDWDGVGKGNIVITGEQGLGDVISFGSMIPDMVDWCEQNDSRLILDVDERLGELFKRSFPKAKVYGTREADSLDWDEEDRKVDYSLPMGQLAEYFRLKDEDFPGTPYLTVDPERALMWKSLFQSKGKPAIGLAWRGGIPRTASRYRQLSLEQLLPILRSVEATWVSLQYKDSTKEIEAFKREYPDIDLVEYPSAMESRKDYDDAAALVSALDHCVIMQTTVGHCAGAVGTPCWTFVPLSSQWRYGEGYEDFVWAKSIRLLRQTKRGEWADLIEKTAGELRELFGNH